VRHLIPTSILVVTLAGTLFLAASPETAPGRPQYAGDNQLLRPADYREWIFLSSGLGMSYSAQAGHEMFTNVFVPQWAYQEFLKSGKWPEKTMFVVEDRGATSKGSINKVGHYQTDSMGIGVEVKDASHFPDKWAYFNFDEDTKSANANPKAACWQCHEDHAAVEHSFVQFYPTLRPVAKKFGTYREAAEKVE
jgi:Cytochrome P460